MYNHYIPQSDGSFRRNYVPENNRRSRPSSGSQVPQKPSPPPPPVPEPPEVPCEPQEPCKESPQPCPPQPYIPREKGQSPLSFLRSLLPKDIDSTDMIVIALLLLLSGEDCDGDLSPLLTIALYFLL